MKWLVYHLATAGLLFIAIETIGVTIYPAIFDGWFYLIALAIFWLGLPVVFGFAIFKYRLYDIDIIVNRALVYGLLTLLLALIYFGSIIVLQRIFTTSDRPAIQSGHCHLYLGDRGALQPVASASARRN